MIPSILKDTLDRVGNLGWIEPSERSREQREANEAAQAKMMKVRFTAGETPPVGTKVLLTDYWKHPATFAAFGGEFTGTHQLTGSCVGFGGGNVEVTRVLVDCITKGDFEKIIFPAFLVNYGRSRLLCGMRGEGEGSMGATFAQSAAEDGTPDSSIPGLPQPSDKSDGWIWGSRTEMHWSNGSASDLVSQLPEAKKHLTKTVELKSGAEVRDMILALNPVTTAYGRYISRGTVKNGACVGDYDGSGGHQTSWQGYWNHPELGELIWYQNQWGLRQYPSDPGGGPAGGTWQPMAGVDRVCKGGDGEVYAFLDYNGYLPPTFSMLI